MPGKSHSAKDDLKHETAAAPEDLETIAENAGRYARKMLDETHHLGDGADALVAAIREEPIKTALIALGIGAVLGFLIRR